MGKTWRERYVEAVQRGFFTYEDKRQWQNVETCPAADTTIDDILRVLKTADV